MVNSVEQQAQSEITDLFRLIIFHIPSIAGNMFVRTNIEKPSERITSYTHTHEYTESDGTVYEIDITLAVGYEVTRKGQSPPAVPGPASA